VEQLLELLEVNDGRMPNEMDVTFALDDQLIQLKLKKNRNVPSNAPLFVTNDAGNVVEWKSTDERVSNKISACMNICLYMLLCVVCMCVCICVCN